MTNPVKLSGPMLPPVSGNAKSAVVLLHGYGSDGRDLIGLGQFWRDTFPDTIFVAPNAPEVCAGNPFGYQWFPLDLERDRDLSRLAGAETAAPVITAFLDDLWAYAGLRLPESLLGIISCSGLVIAPEKLQTEIASKPPVLLVHGDMDDVVPVMGSEVAMPILLDLGIDAKLHISQGTGHSIAQDGL